MVEDFFFVLSGILIATGSQSYILLWWRYIALIATQPQLHVWLRELFKRQCTQSNIRIKVAVPLRAETNGNTK